MTTLSGVEAVIVAGGRATRMGGVDKPTLLVRGRRMIDTVLAAVAGCRRVTVVGPHRDDLDPTIGQVQETPPGAGPVAALAAAPIPSDAPVLVLAADLPFVTEDTVIALLDGLHDDPDADAAFAVDTDGRIQFLLAAWRGSALTSRLDTLTGEVANQPMKALLPGRYASVAVPGTADCDTPEDLYRARTASSGTAPDPDLARVVLRESMRPLTVRTVPARDAFGTTLAAPLVAAEALPQVAVSAMDGYAIAGDEPWTLRSEIRYAGSDSGFALADGEAARIATGAHLPPGATAVVRDEHVDVGDGGVLRRRRDAPVRDDTRRRGEDWQPGFVLAQAGTAVDPAVVSAASSGEVTDIEVRGPLRVHIVVSGDEIRRDGPLRDGQTRDSLGPVLGQFVRWCGADPVSEAHLRDTVDGFDRLLRETTDVDVIVVVGATGGGAADQLRGALARAGAHIAVERVQCKPGGSQVAAVLPDGRAVLGLPGNPVAAITTLLIMLPPVIDGRTCRTPDVPWRAPLVNASEVVGDVTRLLPARRLPDGGWMCDNAIRTSHLAGLIGRQAIALVPPGAVDGDLVELVPLPRM